MPCVMRRRVRDCGRPVRIVPTPRRWPLSIIDESPKIAWRFGHAYTLGWPDLAAESLGEVIRITQEVRAFGAVLPN
jgi:hypothetical protein